MAFKAPLPPHLVRGPGDGVEVGPAGVQRRVHVRHLSLQQLELPDRVAELLPLVGVVESHVARSLQQWGAKTNP